MDQDGFSYLQMFLDEDGDDNIILSATQYEKSIEKKSEKSTTVLAKHSSLKNTQILFFRVL